jgi:enterochelin esterase-like enzyme
LDVKASELIEAGKINPLIIVCPDMENSYGINSSPKYSVIGGSNRNNNLSQGMFEDYFIKELIPFIDANYSTDARMESRYAGGLSMGGFISLYFAFNHPDLFSKVGGHSPALFMDELPNRLGPWLYPNEETRKERDPIEIAREKNLSALSVYLDCGDKDSYRFYEGCEKLYGILKENNVKAQYSLNPGEHTGEYWKSHSEEYLLFYAGTED